MDDQARARRVLDCTDLTTLTFKEEISDLQRLMEAGLAYRPAACCIPRNWLEWWRGQEGGDAVQLATVLNFPSGNGSLLDLEREAKEAAAADEWDLVFPHEAFRAGDAGPAREALAATRELSQHRLVKVILETGVPWERKRLQQAAELALEWGADFLKTSTGKVEVGATPEAVAQLLDVLRGTERGMKISGGVRTMATALNYLDQVESVMGEAYLRPERFRFGTSTVLMA